MDRGADAANGAFSQAARVEQAQQIYERLVETELRAGGVSDGGRSETGTSLVHRKDDKWELIAQSPGP